jgi:predicted N-formylglutamate amidohydrolase
VSRHEQRRTIACVVSCEHGGNRIPAAYRALFRSSHSLLASHRGYDPGALTMAKALARACAAPLVASTVSRLLIELNRSPWHRQLYSEVMRRAPREAKEAALERYYKPYRAELEAGVRRQIRRGSRVIHISSHSFTPRLRGVVRAADVGLLYDPARRSEKMLCERWQAALRARAPWLRVRRNYPYAGYSDGLTTYLRTRFDDAHYSGIELEINQRHPLGDPRAWTSLRRIVVGALRDVLADVPKSVR